MGPPPFSDGNLNTASITTTELLAFNGATAFQRWKPGGADDLWIINTFNGATAFQRWKPPGCTACPDLLPAFNGATAFQRWKPVRLGLARWTPTSTLQWGHRLSAVETTCTARRHLSVPGASMGPPPFSDGNLGTGQRRPGDCRGSFNGATAFQRWKHAGGNFVAPVIATPSMGPPPFSDGNMNQVSVGSCTWALLQWGHRLSAMET